MSWKPTGNSLAVIDVMGKYGVWESVIPSSMKSPTEDVPSLQSKNSNGLLLFDEDEKEPSACGSLSDLGEDSHGESVPPVSRKRLRKASHSDDNSEEDIDEELNMPPRSKSNKKPAWNPKERLDNGDGKTKSVMVQSGSKMQEPFQPGATPVQPGTKCFLCYNMLGSITTMQNDGYSHIEV